MGSKDVYSEDWWAEHNNENRCGAHRKSGERCLKQRVAGGVFYRLRGAFEGGGERGNRVEVAFAEARDFSLHGCDREKGFPRVSWPEFQGRSR